MAEVKNDKIDKTKNVDAAKIKSKTGETSTSQEKEYGFLVEAAKNIEASVETVGEKFSEVAEKTIETAGGLYQTMKNGLSSTYDAGSKVVDDISQSAQNYIEKYKQNIEMKKLSDERDRLSMKLGREFFTQFKTNKEENVQLLLKKEEISNLIIELEK
ncbi:hypothetical protein ACFLSX_02280, partial [Calditrichota bacterium]